MLTLLLTNSQQQRLTKGYRLVPLETEHSIFSYLSLFFSTLDDVFPVSLNQPVGGAGLRQFTIQNAWYRPVFFLSTWRILEQLSWFPHRVWDDNCLCCGIISGGLRPGFTDSQVNCYRDSIRPTQRYQTAVLVKEGTICFSSFPGFGLCYTQ